MNNLVFDRACWECGRFMGENHKPGCRALTVQMRTEAQVRKDQPLATGCLDYFPDALTAVAELSRIGNEQHNPGTPLHWDRSKSGDEANALLRHLRDRGTIDTDGVRHSTKVAWRALALLQKELEAAKRPPIILPEGHDPRPGAINYGAGEQLRSRSCGG